MIEKVEHIQSIFEYTTKQGYFKFVIKTSEIMYMHHMSAVFIVDGGKIVL